MQIIVLGNGFDLGNDLPTKYTDFFDDLMHREMLFNKEYELINKIMIAQKNSINDYRSKEYILSLFNELNKPEYNFWVIYFILQKFNSSLDLNWSDVEGKVADVVLNLFNHFDFSKESIIQSINTLGDSKNRLSEYICSYKMHEKNNKYSYLHDELIKFESIFKNYIIKVLNENLINTKNFNTYRNNLYKLIEKNTSDIYVLNFNYTSLRISRQNDKIIINDKIDFRRNNEYYSVTEVNVHGDFTKEIIFGIDQVGINADENIDTFAFTKTYRKLFQNFDKNNSGLPKENVTEIIFYGHSLAKADYSYFQSLFDYYDIYNSNLKIIFKYSIYDVNIKNKIKFDYVNSVTKLMETYGKTLNNINHGKNLMHKLLLENRLLFEEVSLTKMEKKVL